MSLLKQLKVKKSLVKQVKESHERNEQDERFLPYFNLKDDEEMQVLIVPDVNGNLWTQYRKHGPNLRFKGSDGKLKPVRGIKAIGAYPIDSESPVMQKGYSLLEEDKEEAKKWFPKEYTVMSVIVLKAPFEVKPNPDGNEVKLFNVPYKVQEYIYNQVSRGVIPEEEVFRTPFIISKSKNAGGFASYEHSSFARKMLDDEELETLDEQLQIELFDYDNLDIIPETPTIEELEEWLEKAEVAYAKAISGGKHSDDEDEDDEPTPPKSKLGGTSRLGGLAGKAKKKQPEPDYDEDDVPFDEGSDDADEDVDSSEPTEDEEPSTEAKSKKESLSAKLNRLKRK